MGIPILMTVALILGLVVGLIVYAIAPIEYRESLSKEAGFITVLVIICVYLLLASPRSNHNNEKK